jgi:hypothetical protein
VPGDIKLKYGTPLDLTVTALQSLASSSAFTSGWTSETIDNTSVLATDYMVGANLYAGTTPTAGEIRVYAYACLKDVSGTPTWPDLFSSGTEGTQGAATLHDTENLDSGIMLLWSSAIDTSTDGPYPMPPRSIRQAFNNVPQKFALYVAHNSVAALKSTLQAIHAVPILDQYT